MHGLRAEVARIGTVGIPLGYRWITVGVPRGERMTLAAAADRLLRQVFLQQEGDWAPGLRAVALFDRRGAEDELEAVRPDTGKSVEVARIFALRVSMCIRLPATRDRAIDRLRVIVSLSKSLGGGGLHVCEREVEGHADGIGAARQAKMLISASYKFYLAIENTILPDYLTEKASS